jgi:hypothetical protein
LLFHTSPQSETRILTIIGAAVALCCTGAAALYFANPFAGRADDRVSVAIDTPYVVQGVAPGTAVIMHGVEVGKVTSVSSLPGQGVRLDVGLQKTPVAGLTDAMQIDFRPTNYFGVTGVNITPGTGGQALRDGMQINTVPTGNFTIQALLSRLSDLSTKVITPQLIDVIDRTTRYTDALNPLIETLLIATNTVAEVQTVPTARLLSNATGLSVVFPSLLNSVTDVGDAISNGDGNFMRKGIAEETPEQWRARVVSVEAAGHGLFGSIGRLESSHVADLLPLVNGIETLSDTAPTLLRPVGLGDMLVELRSRFEKLYAGTPEQRALQVRIVLDSLPGVAAPLGVMGGR